MHANISLSILNRMSSLADQFETGVMIIILCINSQCLNKIQQPTLKASHRTKSSLSLQDQIRKAVKECYQETTKDSPPDYLLFAAKHAAANGL